MTIWYTSDLHLNHARLCEIKFRDFDNEVAMNYKILENICALVKPDDILYILGDLCMSNTVNDAFAAEWLTEIKKRCNCRIYVVKGNHDKSKSLDALKKAKIIEKWASWFIVNDDIDGVEFKVACFHHPVIDYHTGKEADACFHGHSHGMLQIYHPPDLFDVGLDAHDFKPVTAKQLIENRYPVSYAIDFYKRDVYKYQQAYRSFIRQYATATGYCKEI